MVEFYQKRRLKRIMYSPPALAVVALVVGLLASGAWSAYNKQAETGKKRAAAAAELALLSAREGSLKADLAKLDTDAGVESEIRQRFEVGKEHEHMIVVVDPPAPQASSTPEEPKHWWSRLFSWF